MPMRCRCPPERRLPHSPTGVSIPRAQSTLQQRGASPVCAATADHFSAGVLGKIHWFILKVAIHFHSGRRKTRRDAENQYQFILSPTAARRKFPHRPGCAQPHPGGQRRLYIRRNTPFSPLSPRLGGINASLFPDPIASGPAGDPSVKSRLSRPALLRFPSKQTSRPPSPFRQNQSRLIFLGRMLSILPPFCAVCSKKLFSSFRFL